MYRVGALITDDTEAAEAPAGCNGGNTNGAAADDDDDDDDDPNLSVSSVARIGVVGVGVGVDGSVRFLATPWHDQTDGVLSSCSCTSVGCVGWKDATAATLAATAAAAAVVVVGAAATSIAACCARSCICCCSITCC